MISKWSSKPADHQRTRLRNNQRRHRERVKNHVAELEAQLSETQLRLEKALARIDDLSNELLLAKSQPRNLGGLTPPRDEKKDAADGMSNKSVSALKSEVPYCTSCRACPSLHEDATTIHTAVSPGDPTSRDDLTLRSTSRVASLSLPSNDVRNAPTPKQDAIEPAETDSDCDLPPPDPWRSTTRCQDAFVIIAQQNYRGLDISAIREWLESGFRGPGVEGDGCRVETDVLFALLDYISSS